MNLNLDNNTIFLIASLFTFVTFLFIFTIFSIKSFIKLKYIDVSLALIYSQLKKIISLLEPEIEPERISQVELEKQKKIEELKRQIDLLSSSKEPDTIPQFKR